MTPTKNCAQPSKHHLILNQLHFIWLKISIRHQARVQGAHSFLCAKGIAYDECDIFEFFNKEEQVGYRMIPGVFSRIHHHSVEVKTCGQKKKLQVMKVDRKMQFCKMILWI